MPRQTDIYKLGYFVDGELTDLVTEERRFKTIDSQLLGLYQMVGNGIVSGWEVYKSSSDEYSVSVSAGKGVASFVSIESKSIGSLGPFSPNTTQYIYALPTLTSYWDGSVAYVSYMSGGEREGMVLLAEVIVGDNGVTSIVTTGRKYVGLLDSIKTLIQGHHHTGVSGQPEPVDLSSEVQGYISQTSLPNLSADIVQTGVFEKDRIPKIDHDTGLINKGLLTHAQLDTFVESLLIQENNKFGETLLTNFLQLVLALKHQWPEIDEYLYNIVAFIPGVSPNDLIDTVNTTATVDTRTYQEGGEHKIYGTAASSYETFAKSWKSKDDFDSGTSIRMYVGDGNVRLASSTVKAHVDDFEDVTDWNVNVLDLSPDKTGLFDTDGENKVQGAYSGKLNIVDNTTTRLVLLLEKKFSVEDWSNYNRIVFYFYCETPQHGDIYFYINDSTYGAQNSEIKILSAGDVTINQETLMVGWREYSVDISAMQRGSIDSVGFYTSTEDGWNPSQEMFFNIDDMYLTTGNKFSNDGYVRFIYGDSIPKEYYKIDWASLNPTGTVFRVKTRMADSEADFYSSTQPPTQPPWNNLIITGSNSGDITNPTGALYKYIEIEVYMEASSDTRSSAELHKLNLYARNVAIQSSFAYDTKTEWESAQLTNIDTTTHAGSITIGQTNNLNTVFTGTSDGQAIQLGDDLKEILQITGGLIPRSTNQIVEDVPSSFGQISGIDYGANDTIWLADTTNDRVLNIDKNGNLITGFYGTYLETPQDNYGKEEQGPGSNTTETLALDEYTEEQVQAGDTYKRQSFDLIQSVYNPITHILSLVFNAYLKVDNLNTLDPNKAYISLGANRFYLNDCDFSLLGVDVEKYNGWYDYFLTENMSAPDPKFMFQWMPHVLQAKLPQNEYSALEYQLELSSPTIYITNLYENIIVYDDNISVDFVVNNLDLGGDDDYKISWQIDGSSIGYTYLTSINLTGLTQGEHFLTANLVDKNNLPLSNVEASAYVHFVYSDENPYTEPFISIKQPKNCQKIMSSTAGIVFSAGNFAITPSGPHIRYILDDNASVAHYSSGTIILRDLSAGEHTVELYLANADGTRVTSGYSSAEIQFYVYNQNSLMKVFIEKEFLDGYEIGTKLFSQDATTPVGDASSVATLKNGDTKQIVDVSNIHFNNIYAPIDVEFVQGESTDYNPSGKSSVLIGKLRGESSTACLKSPAPIAGAKVAKEDVFESLYADGHSVVQITEDNTLIFSNNAPKFAKSKAQVSKFLGSVEKLSEYHILSADTIRKRAIITYTDHVNKRTFVSWEYGSDRYVSDARTESENQFVVKIYNNRVEPAQLMLRIGTVVVFQNYSSNPVYVYSGETTHDRFVADPDLTVFGDDFISEEMAAYQSGIAPAAYSIKFNNKGSFSYFVYPNIDVDNVVGEVFVQESNATNSSNFLIVENDPTSDLFGNRVIKIDSWGNVIWSFGDGMLYNPKDIRIGKDSTYLISV